MEKASKKIRMPAISIIKRKIITMFHNNNTVLDECSLINVKRAYYLSMIAIPMRVLDIIMFSSSSTSLLRTWKQGFLFATLCYLFLLGCFPYYFKVKE